MFFCALCERPEKDIPRGCPKCALTEAYEDFKSGVEEEINRRYGGFNEWSFDELLRILSYVRKLLDENEGRINPEWDVTTAALARVLKSERDRARFMDDWNFEQDCKNKRK